MNASAAAQMPARYAKRRKRQIDRRMTWIIGAVLAGCTLLFFITANWQHSTVEFKDISFKLGKTSTGDHFASAKFEVTAQPHAKVACAVQALDTSKGTIGWKVVELPQISGITQNATVRMVTIGPATTAHVRQCWELSSTS